MSQTLDPKQFDLFSDGTAARPPRENRLIPCGCEQAEEVDDRSGYFIWRSINLCKEHGGQ